MFEIKSLSSILCLSFVYIRCFSQYSELEKIILIAKRLQDRQPIETDSKRSDEHENTPSSPPSQQTNND